MDKYDEIKEKLDKQLTSANRNVGIAFSEELFTEFKNRNWFTLETFGVLGTTLFSHKIPAYNKTHFAFLSWDIEGSEFKVGSHKENS